MINIRPIGSNLGGLFSLSRPTDPCLGSYEWLRDPLRWRSRYGTCPPGSTYLCVVLNQYVMIPSVSPVSHDNVLGEWPMMSWIFIIYYADTLWKSKHLEEDSSIFYLLYWSIEVVHFWSGNKELPCWCKISPVACHSGLKPRPLY